MAAKDAEVRAWLKANRPDVQVGVRGRLSSEAWDAYLDGSEEFTHSEEITPDFQTDLIETDEITPVPPPKKSKWNIFGTHENTAVNKPRSNAKRVSTSMLMEAGWRSVGGLVGRFTQVVVDETGQQVRIAPLVPVARTMELQAPVAGEIFDDVIKGTVVDKMVQPLARMSEKGEEVFALVGPPMVATAICMQPALYPVLKPVMASALKSWVVTAGPRMKKAKEKEEKLIAELGEDYGASIEEMLDYIFGVETSNEQAE